MGERGERGERGFLLKRETLKKRERVTRRLKWKANRLLFAKFRRINMIFKTVKNPSFLKDLKQRIQNLVGNSDLKMMMNPQGKLRFCERNQTKTLKVDRKIKEKKKVKREYI